MLRHGTAKGVLVLELLPRHNFAWHGQGCASHGAAGPPCFGTAKGVLVMGLLARHASAWHCQGCACHGVGGPPCYSMAWPRGRE